MSLVDSALKSAQKLVDGMGNGGVAAVHASNKLFGDGFELTCLGWAIRGVDPVNLCSWEEVNHVGDNKPNELGFVHDFSYKYKIHAIHYYGYPSKLQDIKFFVDDLGPLKSKLREHKKEEYMRESIDLEDKTYEDLLGDYICIRSFRHPNQGEVCRKGYHYTVDEIAPDGRVVINGWYVDLNFLKDHFEKVEDKEMTIEEAKEILSKSGKKAVNESWRDDFEEDGLARFHLYLKLYDEDGNCIEDQEYGDPYTYGHDPIDETEIESWIGRIKRKWLKGVQLFSQKHDPNTDKLVIKGEPVIGSEDYFIAKSYDWTTKHGSKCKAWEDVWF